MPLPPSTESWKGLSHPSVISKFTCVQCVNAQPKSAEPLFLTPRPNHDHQQHPTQHTQRSQRQCTCSVCLGRRLAMRHFTSASLTSFVVRYTRCGAPPPSPSPTSKATCFFFWGGGLVDTVRLIRGDDPTRGDSCCGAA